MPSHANTNSVSSIDTQINLTAVGITNVLIRGYSRENHDQDKDIPSEINNLILEFHDEVVTFNIYKERLQKFKS